MEEFITMCKTKANEDDYKCLVMGDVSSYFSNALATISLAFYLQNRRDRENDVVDYYIPVLNNHRDVIDSMTDVICYLEKFGIKSDDLLCLDDIHDPDNFDMFIFLDYYGPHISMEFDETLVQMLFVKEKLELDFEPGPHFEMIYKEATSIATVVADYIVQKESENLTDDDKLALRILYDCLLYKTNDCRVHNYFEHDQNMIADLEADQFLGPQDPYYRATLTEELQTAFDDITNLNSFQLLYKYYYDWVKANGKSVFITYIPISIQELIDMPQYRAGVAELATWMACDVMIILGSTVDEENNTKKYIGILNFSASSLHKRLVDKMLYDSKLKLCYRGWFPGLVGKFFRNHNPQVNMDDVKEEILSVLNAAD